VVTLALKAPQETWKQLVLEELPKGSFDTVFGVLQLQSGEVILTGTRGVVRLLRPGSGRSGGSTPFRAHTYSIEDGLPSDFCTARSLLEDAAGRVVVGTVNGLAFLEPRIAAENRASSPLRFRAVKAPGLHWQEGTEGQELNLSSRQSGITFDYTLITLTRWRETRYQSQLVGLESTPTAWGSDHRREFTRLPPGNYQFLVWARDFAGIHSGPLSLRFKVRPAVWETGWFFGLCGVVGVVLLWGGIRTRERILLAHNRELANLVAAQTGALQEANADLKKEVQERKAAERVKDDFTSMVSHELRTPLTAIRGALGLVASGALDQDPETRKKMIEVSQRNSIRLLVLVNDLLDIQKIEAGMLSLQPEAIPLETTLLQTVQANHSFAESLGVTLDLVPCPAPINIWADPLRLEQALTNLISNATKFSPKGGRVEIRTELHSHRVRIFIHNTGEPISDAFRPQIFQKFSQSDIGTTRAVKGTGLGLAITKAIIDGMGGRIDFESGPGGTTFWIELAQANDSGSAKI
jgi:signal transduction histidine kinase